MGSSARAMAHYWKAGGLRSVLRPSQHDVVKVTSRSFPDLALMCEQQGLKKGPAATTGGRLWYTDRVMAEYLAYMGMEAALGQVPTEEKVPPGKGTAIALGCGGVPLSGLVACALGWNVVLTDLESMLPQAQQNVDRNLDALRSVLNVSSAVRPPISVLALPFGDEVAVQSVLLKVQEGRDRHNGPQPVLLLCSDCIWLRELHRPLLTTIGSLLHGVGRMDQVATRHANVGAPASALVAFAIREPGSEAAFLRLARRSSLDVARVDLQDTLTGVEWPVQVKEAVLSGTLDLSDHFRLYRMKAGNAT
mmetsp:Transcript_12571/g.35840  ORF Transcript_12571/g.35840 Transcript_12571/m.35840 type:complete len:306 (-) Transcript_12571:334-1251(-)